MILPLLSFIGLNGSEDPFNLSFRDSENLDRISPMAIVHMPNGGDSVPNNVALGAGWVIGGILALVAGIVAVLPAVADFLGKKK